MNYLFNNQIILLTFYIQSFIIDMVITMKLTVTDFESAFRTNDPKGRKTLFRNRYSACIIVTLKGRICFSFDGGYVVSDKYTPIFLPEGLTYTNECLETADSFVFNFHVSETDLIPQHLVGLPDNQVTELYKNIKEYESSMHSFRYAGIMSKIYTLIYMTSKHENTLSGTDAIMEKALSYMKDNYHNPKLTVSETAAHCYISEIYLRKLFSQKKNTTPHRVLTDIRMQKAHSYALEKRPIKEIALNVGYSDVYQFSRAYKRYFGYSPKLTH